MAFSPLRKNPGPDRDPDPGPWIRAGRTLWLGLVLGLAGGLLTLGGIGLVGRADIQGPRLDPRLPERAVHAARRALGDMDQKPEWRIVVHCQTPWEECIRLRPFVAGLEVRGCDCILHLPAGPIRENGASSEPPARPGSQDRSRDQAREPENGDLGRTRRGSGSEDLDSWTLERNPASVDWAGMAAVAAGVPAPSILLVRTLGPLALGVPRVRALDPLALGIPHGIVDRPATTPASSASPSVAGIDSTTTPAGSASPSAAGADSSSVPEASVQPYFVLEEPGASTPWRLEMEVPFRPALLAGARAGLPESSQRGAATLAAPPRPGAVPGDAALAALPWRGAVPSGTEPVDIRLTLDPSRLTVLEARDARIFADGSAHVFDPNPVVTSGRRDLRYGDPVDAWRLWEPLHRLDDTGHLRGQWIRCETNRPPAAQEPGFVFDYSSFDPRFDEAMAYFHGDRALELVDSLGFHGLFPTPLSVLVHGTLMDDSWYSQAAREVVLGDGGVPDGDDADIILHEIGHAIHAAFVPGFGGGDATAISEGFGDFWAASLTGDPCVGDWDATAYSPPCLRRTDTGSVYPASLSADPHVSGEIWSATLWDLRALLGPADAERLALAGFMEQGPSVTFPEAAQGLLSAADRIGLGDRRDAIEETLVRRGLVPRNIDLTLASGDVREIDLPSPALFLGRTVRAVLICGDGRLVFVPEDAPGGSEGTSIGSIPSGSPNALACGPPSDGSGTVLHVTGQMDSQSAMFTQDWGSGSFSLARATVSWNPEDGGCAWTYLDLRSNEPGGGFPVDVEVGSPDSLRQVNLESLGPGGISGLSGFRATIETGAESGAALIGARFAVAAESSGRFRLYRLSPGIGATGSRPILAAVPNPFQTQTSLEVYLANPGSARIELFDLAGRRIRSFSASLPAGLSGVLWDGNDGIGRRVAAGVYWARVEAGGAVGTLHVLRLK